MRKTSLLALSALLLAAAPLTASASLPLQYSERPLTLTEGTLAIDAALGIHDLVIDTGISLNAGVQYGVSDDLEIGALVLPLVLSPNSDYGNPSVNATYRLINSVLELGASAYAILPVADGANFDLGVGVSGLLGLDDTTSLHFGAYLDIDFADPDAILSLLIPVQFRLNFNPNAFFFASSGLNLIDFELNNIPLGAGVGYTLPAVAGGPQMDLSVGINFPFFLNLNDGDTIITDFWTMSVGGTFYL